MILALVLVLVPPLALTAVELVASLVWPPLGRALHVVFVGVLGAAVAVGVLKKVMPSESMVLVPAAAAAGAAIAAGYVRAAPVRTFLTALVPAPAVFLAVFLLFSPVSELVLRRGAAAAEVSLQSDTPVVLVIFDECQPSPLMSTGGQIDAAATPASGSWPRHRPGIATPRPSPTARSWRCPQS